nr:SAM-dependent methyltransferase [Actinoallomurus iriomotensis]
MRTRLIDDLLGAALAGGARQVVLLGAGYDSRAYRLPAARRATVFEVDHPATQERKRRLVERAVPAGERAHVRFVPADLKEADLASLLRDAGVRQERTAVVWEGVTNYLDARSVDAAFTALAGVTAPGSRVIFTYMDRRALDGSGTFTGIAEWAASVSAAGEPFTFGLLPDELPGHLAEQGLSLVIDRSAREAAADYLAPLGRAEPAAPFYHVAEAEVPSAEGQRGAPAGAPPGDPRRRRALLRPRRIPPDDDPGHRRGVRAESRPGLPLLRRQGRRDHRDRRPVARGPGRAPARGRSRR